MVSDHLRWEDNTMVSLIKSYALAAFLCLVLGCSQQRSEERILEGGILSKVAKDKNADVAVQTVGREIAEVCKNGIVCEDVLKTLNDLSAKMSNADISYICSQVDLAQKGGLFDDAKIDEIDEAGVLGQYLEANMIVTRALAEARMEHGMYSFNLAHMEYAVLARLMMLMERYRVNGRQKAALIVEGALKRWTEECNSYDSMTYRFMKWQVESDAKLVERGLTTRAKVLRGARTYSEGLKTCGLVPCWLEEFKDEIQEAAEERK